MLFITCLAIRDVYDEGRQRIQLSMAIRVGAWPDRRAGIPASGSAGRKVTSMPACPAVCRLRVLAGPLLIAAAVLMPAAAAVARTAPAPAAALAGTGVLNNVVATSARNAWAVGHAGSLIKPSPLIMHWNGTRWNRVPGLNPAIGWLDGVAATSARDVWAVGYSGSRTLILHWNGAAWKRMHSPTPAGGNAIIADVTAISRDDAWAVGISGSKTLILHWSGTSWTLVHSPKRGKTGVLTGVSASSARDAWAVGSSATGKSLILHWNGMAWKQVPNGAHAVLARVDAISTKDAWATGSSGSGTLILHWNGTAWTRTPSPAVGSGAGLVGVSGTSAHNVWAVGATSGLIDAAGGRASFAATVTGMALAPLAASLARHAIPLILHWNGTRWKRVHIPVPASGGNLIGVFAASGRSAWAVGCTRFFADPKARPVVLHWNGTAWKAAPIT